MKSGVLERRLWDYKYGNGQAWRLIFSRLLVGFLDEEAELFEDFDTIIPMLTYVGPEEGARKRDHIRPIVESAATLTTRWPLKTQPRLIERTKHIPTMKDTQGFRARIQLAEHDLRAALHIPFPHLVEGKNIAVFDDTFTTGLTLREVARALKAAGATRICGITLVRQPWK